MTTLLTLHDPQKAREYYLAGTWQADTMYTLARQHARERPTACALRDPYVRLTWREVLERTEVFSEDLHRSGLKTGDRVAAWLPSCVEMVIAFLACSRNGYIFCPSLHQNYTVQDVIALAQRMRCKALLAMPGYGADADRNSIFERSSQMPQLKRLYTVTNGNHTVPENAVAFPNSGSASATRVTPNLNPDKIVYLAFTSGTTGPAKGVMHSDNTLLSNGRALIADWHHTQDTILLSLSPLSHHIGTVALEQSLTAGMELVLHDTTGNKSPLDWVLETGATYVMGVPTHAIDILGEMKKQGQEHLGDVRTFYMAGSPIPKEVAQQFLHIGITPQNVYGMTENGSHQYTLPTDPVDAITSTCGRACAGFEVRIWKQDNPDHEALPNEVGEIGTRGGLLMLGYYSDQETTENSFNSSGWFMSGDLGTLDTHGRLKIVGRKKDLIIRGGHNIHPAHIEDLTHHHPAVAKAAAFPVADTRLGERVCLAIIAQPGALPKANEILQHLHDSGLSKYDMPEYYLVLDKFPLTPSGKILKRELIELVKSNQVTPEAVRWRSPGAHEAKKTEVKHGC